MSGQISGVQNRRAHDLAPSVKLGFGWPKGPPVRLRLAIAACLMLTFPAAAYAMDAQSFYANAIALKKQGAAAMFVAELRPLASEMRIASQSVKAENDRAKAAGRPLYCVSKNANMGVDDVLNGFAAIPASRRHRISVTQAWREIIIKRYPC
jgi:hypothetical protein